MKLSDIKPNPNNPRLIKDDKFKKLCKSISEFPQMMELRPIVVDADGMILGGNMRYQAPKHNGVKDIPNEWVKRADDLTEDQKREFIVKDNAGFGEWDWDALANEWDQEDLAGWGLDVPGQENETQPKEERELRPYQMSHVLLSFSPQYINEIMSAIEKIECPYEIEQSAN